MPWKIYTTLKNNFLCLATACLLIESEVWSFFFPPLCKFIIFITFVSRWHKLFLPSHLLRSQIDVDRQIFSTSVFTIHTREQGAFLHWHYLTWQFKSHHPDSPSLETSAVALLLDHRHTVLGVHLLLDIHHLNPVTIRWRFCFNFDFKGNKS